MHLLLISRNQEINIRKRICYEFTPDHRELVNIIDQFIKREPYRKDKSNVNRMRCACTS